MSGATFDYGQSSMTLRKNILIVDRDTVFLHQLRAQFAPHGERFQVAFARQAAKATAILERFVVHLVVVNIHLGGYSGLDLLHLARSKYPSLRVMVSSDDEIHDAFKRTLRHGGATAVLKKPFHADAVVSLMDKMCQEDVVSQVPDFFQLIVLLQIVACEKHSIRLEVTDAASGQTGAVVVLNGVLIKAAVNGGPTGVAALSQMLIWNQPVIHSIRLPPPDGGVLTGMALDKAVLQAVVRLDETLEGGQPEMTP